MHGETRIDYTLVRSARRKRTIGIVICDSGEVVVRAPLRASRAAIDEVVRGKAAWIDRRRREPRHHAAALAEPAGDRDAFMQRASVILEAAVERWAGVMGCSPGPDGRGHGPDGRPYGLPGGRPYGRVLVRNQKRIWGSCARDGTLRFNWRLVLLEQSLIDYVVVHELVHLRVRNHQREFWSAVEAVLPDFRERRKRLRETRIV